MPLTELPLDILFKVLELLPPQDILSLRQTCKRFHSFTLERTVWTSAYSNSGLFLPPGPSDLSVHELERLLTRAHRLDLNWESTVPTFIKPGRFLAIGEVSGFYVYDLHTQQEIFRYNEPNKKFQFWFYRRSATLSIDHGELDLFIPFGKMSTLNDSMKLGIWKIEPSGSVTMIPTDLQMIHISMNIGYGYCVIRQGSGNPILLHIASQKVYTLAETHPRTYSTEVLITPNHILLIYSRYTAEREEMKFLELFPLPQSCARQNGTTLHRTHHGIIPCGFIEPTHLSSNFTSDLDAGTMWLIVLFHDKGMGSFKINFEPDGTMTFCGVIHQRVPETLYIPYDSLFTVISGGRARGVAWTATSPQRPMLAMYSVRLSDERLVVQVQCESIPQLTAVDAYTFDGLHGLLCTAVGDQIIILEFA